MAFFNGEDSYLDQAYKCLIDTDPGTPVNAPKFTKPGAALACHEYWYVLRVAEISQAVWIAATVYSQHYHWQEKRGLWVSYQPLAQTAKVSIKEFEAYVREAKEKKWLVQGADWKTRKPAWFPAIGTSD
jgi:hypothetical protein